MTSSAGRGYGIYAGNLDTAVPLSDSTVLLDSNSLIDMSAGSDGVGVFAQRSSLTIDGGINTGTRGIGVYTENSDVEINSLALNLSGNNGIGLYITGNETLTGRRKLAGVAGRGNLREQQVAGADLMAGAKHHGALLHVLQFAHVARPSIGD